MTNQFTVIYINGKYYVYTRTVVNGQIMVNIERVGWCGMAQMNFDEEGLLEEPCLSCDKPYIEDIWNEWCCDEKECPYKKGNKEWLA